MRCRTIMALNTLALIGIAAIMAIGNAQEWKQLVSSVLLSGIGTLVFVVIEKREETTK